MPCRATGWQSGTRSGVRFAAAMPAMRATASASPLGRPSRRSSAMTSGVVTKRPAARASRAVTSLADTSTMRAAPAASTWVRPALSVMAPTLVRRCTGSLLSVHKLPPQRPPTCFSSDLRCSMPDTLIGRHPPTQEVVVRAARRGLAVLAAAGAAATFAALATPAEAAPTHGVVNPYSPAYGHSYRHGVVPTRAVH